MYPDVSLLSITTSRPLRKVDFARTSLEVCHRGPGVPEFPTLTFLPDTRRLRTEAVAGYRNGFACAPANEIKILHIIHSVDV